MSRKQWGHGYNAGMNASIARRKTEVNMNDELFLLLAAISNPDLYRTIRSSLSPEDMNDHRAKELFIVLEEGFRANSFDFDELIDRIVDKNLKAFVLESVDLGDFLDNPERLVLGGIVRIKRRKLELMRSISLARIRTIRGNIKNQEGMMDEALSNIKNIDEALFSLNMSTIDDMEATLR